MSRVSIPFSAGDISALARCLRDQLNRNIRANHLFGDYALLRRELCDRGLVSRTADGREYRRVERPPSPEGLALIRHLAAQDGRGQ
jgi:Uncharacterized protein conserved in bacteria (DUF2087)